MSQPGSSERKRANRRRSRGLLAIYLIASVGCSPEPAPEEAPIKAASRAHQDLLVGYELLADALSDESQLGALDFFKKLTLDAPDDAIEEMMKTLAKASKRRAAELSKLRRLEPNVSDAPTVESPIGDAITAVAEEFGKDELLSRSRGFEVRFVLVQAQATRMVAAIATAIARFDPNPERKAWLAQLATEYEGYRDGMIEYLGGRAVQKSGE